jgi:hypothetical protein
VFNKKIDENQKESYYIYEIFSISLFAKEIKDFIENVAQSFMNSDQTPEESVVVHFETASIKDSLKCVF